MDSRIKPQQLKEQNANLLLHSSLVKGNKSTLLEALKLGCNLRALSKHGDPPIVAAASVDPRASLNSVTGQDAVFDILDILLERKECDINSRGAGGDTALHRAVRVRSLTRMRYLLERGCDVDIRDSRGQTALFGATEFVEGLDVLLKYRPLLDVYDVDGITPLLHAMMVESPSSLAALKMLTNAGCDVNGINSLDGKSALMATLRPEGQLPRSDQRVEKSLILIARGIDVNLQDKLGRTTLHYAVSSECVGLVKVLLRNKASVEVKDKQGQTVLDRAKLSSNSQVLRLIERAVDKSSRLLPYEDAVLSLESLYDCIGEDGELRRDQRSLIRAQVTELQRSLQVVIGAGRGADMMAVEHKRQIVHKRSVLCEEMMPHFVLTSLLADRVLSEEDVKVISAEKSRSLMCSKLLDTLVHRGSQAYPSLVRALHHSNQSHVCKILCDDVITG